MIAAALATMTAGAAFAQGEAGSAEHDLPRHQGWRVVIKLRPDLAPKHVAQIKALTKRGFYDGIVFHRVIDGFMAQTGDPTGTGMGGSDLPNIPAEFTREPFKVGSVGMARSQSPNSANSQFYLCYDGCGSLTGQYTLWGEDRFRHGSSSPQDEEGRPAGNGRSEQSGQDHPDAD